MAGVELTAVRGGRCAPARNCWGAGAGERGEKGLGHPHHGTQLQRWLKVDGTRRSGRSTTTALRTRRAAALWGRERGRKVREQGKERGKSMGVPFIGRGREQESREREGAMELDGRS